VYVTDALDDDLIAECEFYVSRIIILHVTVISKRSRLINLISRIGQSDAQYLRSYGRNRDGRFNDI